MATAVASSGNAKLGDAATTYAAQTSCPTDCPFLDGGGCYAETGTVGKFVTAPLNAAAAGRGGLDVAKAEAEAIDRLSPPAGRPLRLHTVGDCASDEAARLVAAAAGRYMQRGGGQAWTYTHGWQDVERASWQDVSVLASCETVDDIARAHERGYASSIVVEDFQSDKLYKLAAGVPGRSQPFTLGVAGRGADQGQFPPAAILPCPAQTRGRSCSDCRLCFDDRRLHASGITIGFKVHGVPLTVRRAKLALRTPADPRRREPLEIRLRELLETKPDLTAKAAAEQLSMSEGYAYLLLAHLRDGKDHPSVGRRRRYDRRNEPPEKAALRLAA